MVKQTKIGTLCVLVRLIIGILLTYSGLTLTYYVMILFVTVCVCVCVCVCVLCCCYCLLQSVKQKIGENNLVWKTCLSKFVPLADCCHGFGRCPCSCKREATVHAVYLELHIKVVHSLYSTWLSKPNTSWYAGVKIPLIQDQIGQRFKVT